MKDRTCETCDYYCPFSEDSGQCRINPPQCVGTATEMRAGWPNVGKDKWCGEWWNREEAAADGIALGMLPSATFEDHELRSSHTEGAETEAPLGNSSRQMREKY